MNQLLIDSHTHTAFSPDAKDSLTAMCERAIELGLYAYTVTDHCDCNFWDKTDDKDITDYMMYGAGEYALNSIKAQYEMKQRLEGRLNFHVGIELGQPLQNIEKAEEIAALPQLDLIIGSHHMNNGENDFYYLDYSSMTSSEIDKLLSDCFTQTLEMCRWGKFDVLGHLTYPLRYICGEHGIGIDISKYDELIAEIFKTLINSGKGIEINTSGLRQKYGLTFPDFKYIKLYKDLGGEIITTGSDAHCTADLAKGIPQGTELARQAGFEYIAYYKKHQPVFVRL